jgi:4-hydroxyphenylacetate 3-monooxygenase
VHPAFKGGVETLASLYDLQWENASASLYESPTTGRKVGRSFMIPRTHEELQSISKAMKLSADHTFGMMGRAPDYLNRAITGYAAGAPFLAEANPTRLAKNSMVSTSPSGPRSLW